MIIPNEKKVRIKRLIQGTATERDLDDFFLWARFNSYGYWSVQDIGHFIAHKQERDSGLTWTHASNVFLAINAHTDISIRKQIHLDDLRRGIIASCELDDATEVRRALGVGHNKIKKVTKRATIKIKAYDVEHNVLQGQFDVLESDVLKRYIGRFTAKSVFTQQRYIDNLSEYLLKMGLIKPEEKRLLYEQGDLIAAYIVAKMATSTIVYGGHEPIKLVAGYENTNGIDVLVVRANQRMADTYVNISFALFVTSCPVDSWCNRKVFETTPNDRLAFELLNGKLEPVL